MTIDEQQQRQYPSNKEPDQQQLQQHDHYNNNSNITTDRYAGDNEQHTHYNHPFSFEDEQLLSDECDDSNSNNTRDKNISKTTYDDDDDVHRKKIYPTTSSSPSRNARPTTKMSSTKNRYLSIDHMSCNSSNKSTAAPSSMDSLFITSSIESHSNYSSTSASSQSCFLREEEDEDCPSRDESSILIEDDENENDDRSSFDDEEDDDVENKPHTQNQNNVATSPAFPVSHSCNVLRSPCAQAGGMFLFGNYSAISTDSSGGDDSMTSASDDEDDEDEENDDEDDDGGGGCSSSSCTSGGTCEKQQVAVSPSNILLNKADVTIMDVESLSSSPLLDRYAAYGDSDERRDEDDCETYARENSDCISPLPVGSNAQQQDTSIVINRKGNDDDAISYLRNKLLSMYDEGVATMATLTLSSTTNTIPPKQQQRILEETGTSDTTVDDGNGGICEVAVDSTAADTTANCESDVVMSSNHDGNKNEDICRALIESIDQILEQGPTMIQDPQCTADHQAETSPLLPTISSVASSSSSSSDIFLSMKSRLTTSINTMSEDDNDIKAYMMRLITLKNTNNVEMVVDEIVDKWIGSKEEFESDDEDDDDDTNQNIGILTSTTSGVATTFSQQTNSESYEYATTFSQSTSAGGLTTSESQEEQHRQHQRSSSGIINNSKILTMTTIEEDKSVENHINDYLGVEQTNGDRLFIYESGDAGVAASASAENNNLTNETYGLSYDSTSYSDDWQSIVDDSRSPLPSPSKLRMITTPSSSDSSPSSSEDDSACPFLHLKSHCDSLSIPNEDDDAVASYMERVRQLAQKKQQDHERELDILIKGAEEEKLRIEEDGSGEYSEENDIVISSTVDYLPSEDYDLTDTKYYSEDDEEDDTTMTESIPPTPPSQLLVPTCHDFQSNQLQRQFSALTYTFDTLSPQQERLSTMTSHEYNSGMTSENDEFLVIKNRIVSQKENKQSGYVVNDEMIRDYLERVSKLKESRERDEDKIVSDTEKEDGELGQESHENDDSRDDTEIIKNITVAGDDNDDSYDAVSLCDDKEDEPDDKVGMAEIPMIPTVPSSFIVKPNAYSDIYDDVNDSYDDSINKTTSTSYTDDVIDDDHDDKSHSNDTEFERTKTQCEEIDHYEIDNHVFGSYVQRNTILASSSSYSSSHFQTKRDGTTTTTRTAIIATDDSSGDDKYYIDEGRYYVSQSGSSLDEGRYYVSQSGSSSITSSGISLSCSSSSRDWKSSESEGTATGLSSSTVTTVMELEIRLSSSTMSSSSSSDNNEKDAISRSRRQSHHDDNSAPSSPSSMTSSSSISLSSTSMLSSSPERSVLSSSPERSLSTQDSSQQQHSPHTLSSSSAVINRMDTIDEIEPGYDYFLSKPQESQSSPMSSPSQLTTCCETSVYSNTMMSSSLSSLSRSKGGGHDEDELLIAQSMTCSSEATGNNSRSCDEESEGDDENGDDYVCNDCDEHVQPTSPTTTETNSIGALDGSTTVMKECENVNDDKNHQIGDNNISNPASNTDTNDNKDNNPNHCNNDTNDDKREENDGTHKDNQNTHDSVVDRREGDLPTADTPDGSDHSDNPPILITSSSSSSLCSTPKQAQAQAQAQPTLYQLTFDPSTCFIDNKDYMELKSVVCCQPFNPIYAPICVDKMQSGEYGICQRRRKFVQRCESHGRSTADTKQHERTKQRSKHHERRAEMTVTEGLCLDKEVAFLDWDDCRFVDLKKLRLLDRGVPRYYGTLISKQQNEVIIKPLPYPTMTTSTKDGDNATSLQQHHGHIRLPQPTLGKRIIQPINIHTSSTANHTTSQPKRRRKQRIILPTPHSTKQKRPIRHYPPSHSIGSMALSSRCTYLLHQHIQRIQLYRERKQCQQELELSWSHDTQDLFPTIKRQVSDMEEVDDDEAIRGFLGRLEELKRGGHCFEFLTRRMVRTRDEKHDEGQRGCDDEDIEMDAVYGFVSHYLSRNNDVMDEESRFNAACAMMERLRPCIDDIEHQRQQQQLEVSDDDDSTVVDRYSVGLSLSSSTDDGDDGDDDSGSDEFMSIKERIGSMDSYDNFDNEIRSFLTRLSDLRKGRDVSFRDNGVGDGDGDEDGDEDNKGIGSGKSMTDSDDRSVESPSSPSSSSSAASDDSTSPDKFSRLKSQLLLPSSSSSESTSQNHQEKQPSEDSIEECVIRLDRRINGLKVTFAQSSSNSSSVLNSVPSDSEDDGSESQLIVPSTSIINKANLSETTICHLIIEPSKFKLHTHDIRDIKSLLCFIENDIYFAENAVTKWRQGQFQKVKRRMINGKRLVATTTKEWRKDMGSCGSYSSGSSDGRRVRQRSRSRSISSIISKDWEVWGEALEVLVMGSNSNVSSNSDNNDGADVKIRELAEGDERYFRHYFHRWDGEDVPTWAGTSTSFTINRGPLYPLLIPPGINNDVDNTPAPQTATEEKEISKKSATKGRQKRKVEQQKKQLRLTLPPACEGKGVFNLVNIFPEDEPTATYDNESMKEHHPSPLKIQTEYVKPLVPSIIQTTPRRRAQQQQQQQATTTSIGRMTLSPSQCRLLSKRLEHFENLAELKRQKNMGIPTVSTDDFSLVKKQHSISTANSDDGYYHDVTIRGYLARMDALEDGGHFNESGSVVRRRRRMADESDVEIDVCYGYVRKNLNLSEEGSGSTSFEGDGGIGDIILIAKDERDKKDLVFGGGITIEIDDGDNDEGKVVMTATTEDYVQDDDDDDTTFDIITTTEEEEEGEGEGEGEELLYDEYEEQLLSVVQNDDECSTVNGNMDCTDEYNNKIFSDGCVSFSESRNPSAFVTSICDDDIDGEYRDGLEQTATSNVQMIRNNNSNNEDEQAYKDRRLRESTILAERLKSLRNEIDKDLQSIKRERDVLVSQRRSSSNNAEDVDDNNNNLGDENRVDDKGDVKDKRKRVARKGMKGSDSSSSSRSGSPRRRDQGHEQTRNRQSRQQQQQRSQVKTKKSFTDKIEKEINKSMRVVTCGVAVSAMYALAASKNLKLG